MPVCHLGDMRALFTGIPLGTMNTSMTINATAAWLMALYIAVADEQGAPRAALTGTIQNDIIKEYLSRGTYVFPPKPSMRLIKDVAIFTTTELPKWNPMNICSYHLQEAGATPVQELAFALATAIAVLDTVKASGEVSEEKFGEVVGRISFFVNAGLRFITEMCKMRAFAELWDEITRERYGIKDAKQRLFRYGVQVNSLGLTEQQAENNVPRILLEMLAVTLSKNARARAVQLPAWNEALGLPRPWDQQWSLRMQQILAYETDLLDYGDIFDGSAEIERKVDELKAEAKEELKRIDEMGGAVAAVESGYMKQQLVESNTARLERIERGEQIVVGVNKYLETEPSPLTGGVDSIMTGVGRRRARPARTAEGVESRARQEGRRRCARRIEARGNDRQKYHAAVDRNAPKPASPPANGAGRCARPSANTARRPASATPCATTSMGSTISAPTSTVSRASSGAGSPSWSASPASTAIRTAPSRSRCARAMPACRWSTRASA